VAIKAYPHDQVKRQRFVMAGLFLAGRVVADVCIRRVCDLIFCR
jgi:hypothetical protein